MRKILVILCALTLALGVLAPTALAAPAPKIDVCHYDADTGTFHLINISENAYQAHVDHGDEPFSTVLTMSPQTVWDNGTSPWNYHNVYVQNAIDSGYEGTVVMSRASCQSNDYDFNFSFSNLAVSETYDVYLEDDVVGDPGPWTWLGTFVTDSGGSGAFYYDGPTETGTYSFWVNQTLPAPASVLQSGDFSYTVP